MGRRITHIVENFHYWNRNGWTGWFSRVTRTSDQAVALIHGQPDCNMRLGLCRMTGKRYFSDFGKEINIELKSREWHRLHNVLKPGHALCSGDGGNLAGEIRRQLRESAREAS